MHNTDVLGVSRSAFAGGCYDPIVRTPTLGGRCLDQVRDKVKVLMALV